MTEDNIEKELSDTLYLCCDKVAKKRGFRTPYEIFIKPELPVDPKNRDRIVIIKAGNPPVIFISRLYIEASLKKSSIFPDLRDTIERSLEFLPKMYHTLSLIPIAEAVAMRKDSKRWFRASIPNFRLLLDDHDLEYSYSVTVTDKITGTSITRNGVDIIELKDRVKKEISNMIISSEEMDEYRENVKTIEYVKTKEINPTTIEVIINQNGTETKMEY